MTELIKLSHLEDNAGYSHLIYIPQKTHDSTVSELIKLIKLKTRVVKYADAFAVLSDIIEAKTAYEQILSNKLQKDITTKTKNDMFKTLDISHFTDYIPNTAILMDDAINILKDAKHKKLTNLIFQNRQPRFTFFICCQDSFGIPPSIKRNIDTVWIFAGFTDKTVFGMFVRQFGAPISSQELWEAYSKLGFHDAIVLDYEDGRVMLRCVVNGRKFDLE
jgi:hypothetical protein